MTIAIPAAGSGTGDASKITPAAFVPPLNAVPKMSPWLSIARFPLTLEMPVPLKLGCPPNA
jgi:hypothetical protein